MHHGRNNNTEQGDYRGDDGKSEFGADDAHPESLDIASISRGMRCKGPEKS